ncbi:MAG TPA: PHB depolymerase family esterase [Rugosimonospora sp.]
MGAEGPAGRRSLKAVLALLMVLVPLAGGLGACAPAKAAPASRPSPIAFAASPARPPAQALSAGCGHLVAPGPVTIDTTIGGRPRTLRVYLPIEYTGNQPLPLLLNLHGSGSTAAKQEKGTGLDATADEHGFIVVYPEAARHSGTGFSWNVPGTPSFTQRGPNDVAYLGAVVGLMRQRYCVDGGRVYASGFSGGARMVSQLACTPPVRLAGVVMSSGIRAPAPCHPSGGGVPVLAFHGTADTSNPYDGHGQSYWTYSVPVAAARWARYDGCRDRAAISQPYPGVTVTSYRGCRGTAAVELYTLAGKGHRWPLPAGAFQPNEILWRFLSGQGLPNPSAQPSSTRPAPSAQPSPSTHPAT